MISKAKYRRVYETLRQQIDDGTLRPGDPIPSTTVLCEMYGCSATVVNNAVQLLASAGYIYGQPGIGRFVTERDAVS